MDDEKGRIFILSAPSGAGKTTLCCALLERKPDMLYSVSYTTREKRRGEKNGIDYYFISTDKFEQGIRDQKWAEWAKVHGNYYGTSAEFLNKALTEGCDILLDIDVQGTEQILKRYPKSISIFILPPSLEALKQRLERRGTDSKAVIDRRLRDAEKELARKDLYTHIIVNDDLPEAIEKLTEIVESYLQKG